VPARRELRVNDSAQHPTHPTGSEQVAVPRRPQVEPLRGVHDELHGLGAVSHLDHADHDQQRYDKWRRARRTKALEEVDAGALAFPCSRRHDATAKRRDERCRHDEREPVDQERDCVRRHGQEDRPDRRTNDHTEVLHRVQ
jgi:hypothetical protein